VTNAEIEVGRTGARGKIKIDGQDISGLVRGFSLDAGVSEATTLHLDLLPPRVSAQATDLTVHIQPKLAALLETLGWNPPPPPAEPEQASERVTIMASPEIIEQLKDWSAPLQVKIQKVGERWEMDMRTVTEGPALGLLKRL